MSENALDWKFDTFGYGVARPTNSDFVYRAERRVGEWAGVEVQIKWSFATVTIDGLKPFEIVADRDEAIAWCETRHRERMVHLVTMRLRLSIQGES